MSNAATSIYSSPRGMRADRALSYAWLERAANRFRDLVAPSLGVAEALPGIQLFERLQGFRVRTRSGQSILIEPAVNDLPLGMEALAMFCNDRIVLALSTSTYNGLESDEGHDRFTAVHEIGHAAVHCNELMRLSRIPHVQSALARGASDHEHYYDTEWQADAFGSALLMPARGLATLEDRYGRLTPKMVQETFKVSSSAAAIRISVFKGRRSQLL